jgi:hypothetical protein
MRNTTRTRLVLLLLCLAAAGAFLRCDLDRLCFKRNPKLYVLAQEPGVNTLLQPTWSSDGSAIYYLRSPGFFWTVHGGSLWRMTATGSGAEEVLRDTFCTFAVAPDGATLALGVGRNRYEGGRLAIFDLSAGTVDTLPSSQADIVGVFYTKTNPTRLYYFTSNRRVYSINLDGSGERLVSESEEDFLGHDIADTIALPWVHPSGRYAVHTTAVPVPLSGIRTTDLVLVDGIRGDSSMLHAGPWKLSAIESPCWSSDGKRLVFSAAPYETDARTSPGEGQIWGISVFDDSVVRTRRESVSLRGLCGR